MKRLIACCSLAIVTWSGVSFAQDDEPPREEHGQWTKAGLYIAADGGYALRNLYGIPIDAGAVDVGLGARIRWARVFLNLQLDYGSTREGLAVHRYGLGPMFEVAVWRLRPSIGFDMGQLTVRRITTPASSLNGLDMDIRVRLAFDAIEWSHDGALYVAVDMTGNDRFWGPTFVAGVRAF